MTDFIVANKPNDDPCEVYINDQCINFRYIKYFERVWSADFFAIYFYFLNDVEHPSFAWVFGDKKDLDISYHRLLKLANEH